MTDGKSDKFVPNVQWQPGDGIRSPGGAFETVDAEIWSVPSAYKFLVSVIVPRPIAFVTTLNEDGTVNLAPFSFFNGVSTNPPCLMLSVVRRKNGEKKDTLKNIERTGEFVINSASDWMVEPLHHCSHEYPYGKSELEICGFKTLPSLKISPPRIESSAVHFECKVYDTLNVGKDEEGASTIVVGQIVQVHYLKSVYKDGAISFDGLSPLARIGGSEYAHASQTFSMPPSNYVPR